MVSFGFEKVNCIKKLLEFDIENIIACLDFEISKSVYYSKMSSDKIETLTNIHVKLRSSYAAENRSLTSMTMQQNR